MKMIVGLGNPGKQYEDTRHNIGFMAIDSLADEKQVPLNVQTKFQASIGSTFLNNEKVLLVKPLTYMNESGRAVRAISDYYGIEPEDILIIHDDLDLPTGRLRLRQKGSAGGHNGIKSLIQQLDTPSFKRLRIGIDRPQKQSVVDYVLGRFSNEEKEQLAPALDKAKQAIVSWAETDNFNQVMNTFNQKEG